MCDALCSPAPVLNAAPRTKPANPARQDPTRTTPLRRRLLADMSRRFDALSTAIWKLVVDEDAFGLSGNPNQGILNQAPTTNATRWRFQTDAQKAAAFQQWLQDQISGGALQLTGGPNPQPWTSEYVTSAHKQGALRAYTDVHKNKLSNPAGFYQGSQEQFLRDAFDSPAAIKSLELLSTRAYEGLKGITGSMAADMARILAGGLAHGKGPREIARELQRATGAAKTRSLTLARTEIVHAYAEGQLDSFDKLGVDELNIMAEWSTAGDSKVCPLCQPLEGVIMTTKEARGLIPRHPNCRCAWIPTNVGESTKGQTRTKKGIEAAVKASARK